MLVRTSKSPRYNRTLSFGTARLARPPAVVPGQWISTPTLMQTWKTVTFSTWSGQQSRMSIVSRLHESNRYSPDQLTLLPNAYGPFNIWRRICGVFRVVEPSAKFQYGGEAGKQHISESGKCRTSDMDMNIVMDTKTKRRDVGRGWVYLEMEGVVPRGLNCIKPKANITPLCKERHHILDNQTESLAYIVLQRWI